MIMDFISNASRSYKWMLQSKLSRSIF